MVHAKLAFVYISKYFCLDEDDIYIHVYTEVMHRKEVKHGSQLYSHIQLRWPLLRARDY